MKLNQSIISKLEYTASLQRAFLPKKRHFDRIFEDAFQIYLPVEYLSGDFYWVAKKGDIKYLAVGDCTGHGVSAAFLSMLGYNFLNHALHNKKLLHLNEILIEIDKQFIDAFSANDSSPFDNDWIDMSIISYNESTKELCFAGANRKALLIDKNNNSKLLKGSNYPLGGWQIEESRDFPVQKMQFESGTIYLGSDGFQDQFGDKNNKKIGSRRLHNYITSITDQPMELQKTLLLDYFNSWKGSEHQTDDTCIIGVKI